MSAVDDKFGESFTGGRGGRSFFKPEDLVDSTVLMIEVKEARQADNPFYEQDEPETGSNKPTRLEVVANVTFFKSPEALAEGVGEEIPNAVINQTFLAKDLEQSVGKIEVYKLHLQPNKRNPKRKPSWTWRGVEGEYVEQVKAFYVKREEEAEAALSGDDVPDWMKA